MQCIYQVVSTEKIVSSMSAIVKEVAAVVDQQIPSSTVCIRFINSANTVNF